METLIGKAQKFLQSAAVLLELEDFDSCASRAYFAMFYAAQAALMRGGRTLPTSQGIRSAFIAEFVASGQYPEKAAKMLNRAAELQEIGDYSTEFAISRGDAERVLQEAEAFVNSVQDFVLISA